MNSCKFIELAKFELEPNSSSIDQSFLRVVKLEKECGESKLMRDIRTFYRDNSKSRRGIFLNKGEFDFVVNELIDGKNKFTHTSGSRTFKGRG
jgi:hypothetical protein